MIRFRAIATIALVCALGLALSRPGCAQTVTVNATQVYDGSAPANGTIYFAPVLSTGTAASYHRPSGGTASVTPVSAPVANGAFTLTLPDTSLTSPTNICFSVSLVTGSGQVLGAGYSCLQPAANNSWCAAGVCNFDSYIPSTSPQPTIAYVPSIAGVAGAWTCGTGLTCNTSTLVMSAASGGSMTWPGGGAGIANYNGSSAWGTSYSASSQIPANFVNLSAYTPTASLGTGAFATIANYLTTSAAASLYAALSGATFTGALAATGAVDFSASTVPMKVPVIAGCVATASGQMCHDSTGHNWHDFDNGVDNFVAIFPSASPPATGHIAGFSLAGSTWTLSDQGSWASPGVNIGTGTPVNGTFNTLKAQSLGIGTSPPTCGSSATACEAYAEGSVAMTPASGVDMYQALSSNHHFWLSSNGGAAFDSLMNYSLSAVLQPSNNLSDVSSASTALSNLGGQAALGYTPTNAAVVPSTAPTAGQLLVGNAGATAYAPVSLSGDCTLASTGAITCATAGNLRGTPTLPTGTAAATGTVGESDTNVATNAQVAAASLLYLISTGTGLTVPANTVATPDWQTPGGSLSFVTTSTNHEIGFGLSGTVRNLTVCINTAQPSGGALTVTAALSTTIGVSTPSLQTLTVSIPSGSTAGCYSDLTHSFTYTATAAGPGYTYQLTNAPASSASAAIVSISSALQNPH